MQIKVYSGFVKKKNSTLTPAANVGTTLTARLKAGTSITNPTFLLESMGVGANYVYVSDWGRYYFVVDAVQATNNLVELHCVVDVLASAKVYIGSTYAFIERASAARNEWVSDGEIIPTDEIVQNVSKDTAISGAYFNLNSLVVRVIGRGGAKNFIFTKAQLQSVLNDAFGSLPGAQNPTEALNNILVAIAQPSQYIASVKWFPFAVNTSGSTYCYFGFTQSNIQLPVADDVSEGSCTVGVPARYYNDWRDFDPRFTTATLFIPGYGNMDIDPKYLENTITLHYATDINTGACSITVKSGNVYVATLGINAACEVPVGGLSGTQEIGGLYQIATGASRNLMTFASNMKSGATKALEGALTPSHSSTNASGNAEFWLNESNAVLSVSRLGSTGYANSVIGRPLKEYRQLSTIAGYILCSNASVSCPFTSNEKDSINGYLNSGFYYE